MSWTLTITERESGRLDIIAGLPADRRELASFATRLIDTLAAERHRAMPGLSAGQCWERYGSPTWRDWQQDVTVVLVAAPDDAGPGR